MRGGTFDDFLLTPQRSVLARRDPATIDLSCRVSQHLTLKRPIVSANMDTVTRAPMAIVQAEEGGLGVIDRGFRPGDIQPQVREVEIVKRTQHGVISDPYSIAPSAPLDQAAALMARSRVGTLVVLDEQRRLKGLLTERDLRFVTRAGARVADRMTPLEQLVVHQGPMSAADAERIMVERKVKKLPFVGPTRGAARPGHGARPDQAAPPAVRHARRPGTASRRRRDRRDRRLSGAGRGADQGGRGRAGHRHRARPFAA